MEHRAAPAFGPSSGTATKDDDAIDEQRRALSHVDPTSAGLGGRCRAAGKGACLRFSHGRARCTFCGLDLSFADAADGPAIFVMLIIGFLVVGLALYTEVTWNPPLLAAFHHLDPARAGAVLPALRLIKGLLIALQYANKAEQAASTGGSDGAAGSYRAGAGSHGRLSRLGRLALAILLSLGTWQVERLAWKEGLVATIADRMALRRSSRRGRSPLRQEWRRRLRARHRDRPLRTTPTSATYSPRGRGSRAGSSIRRSSLPISACFSSTAASCPTTARDGRDPCRGQVDGNVEIAGLARNPLRKSRPRCCRTTIGEEHLLLEGPRRDGRRRPDMTTRPRVVPFFVDANAAPVPGVLPQGGVTWWICRTTTCNTR